MKLGFADAETRSPLDVTQVGAYPYARHPDTEVLIWSWMLDPSVGPRLWSPEWCWGGDNADITELYDHINEGHYWIAWNAFFDRHIWNEVMVRKYGAPPLRLQQVLCAQAQAEANNLPGSLGKAAESVGAAQQKDRFGKKLINLLSTGTRDDWNPDHDAPEFMGAFRAYAMHDVGAMVDVWQACRPLTQLEWQEYHCSERINDRGVMVDTEFATAAMQYANAEMAELNGRLSAVTGDLGMTLNHHPAKAAWLYDELWPSEELQQLVTKPPKRKGGPERRTCDRATREAVLEAISQPDFGDLFHMEHRERIIEFLEIIEAGNSAAVKKFTAISRQAYRGRVHGQYSFNGAGQTGRYSSRGVQIHNLVRAAVDKDNPDRALDAIEAVLGGAEPDDLVSEFGLPLSRLLARLVRPTFIAPDESTFVWADYDQIEGRCLPWLANSPLAENKLDLYRKGVDTYRVAAMPIFGLSSPDEADDSQRQIGKVAELALGFGGAVGAFRAMAKGYGVVVKDSEAVNIVNAWRQQNMWARIFWDELWESAIAAFNDPGHWYQAGRVAYLFHPDLMKGTLICKLPSGRWLVYPQFTHKWETYEVEQEDGTVTEETRLRTSFVKGFSGGSARVDLWYGILAENVTQATAADMLRLAIKRMDMYPVVVLHTHDEIVCECEERDRAMITECLTESMTGLPRWAEGLPLSISVEHGPYYTK